MFFLWLMLFVSHVKNISLCQGCKDFCLTFFARASLVLAFTYRYDAFLVDFLIWCETTFGTYFLNFPLAFHLSVLLIAAPLFLIPSSPFWLVSCSLGNQMITLVGRYYETEPERQIFLNAWGLRHVFWQYRSLILLALRAYIFQMAT